MKTLFAVLTVGLALSLPAAESVPDKLLEQLKDGGRLVAVEGHGNAGVARLFLKTTGAVSKRRAFNAAIKPLPGFEREHAFEF